MAAPPDIQMLLDEPIPGDRETSGPPRTAMAPRRTAMGPVLRVIVLLAAFSGAVVLAAVASSTASAAPAGALLRGIDVSSWQHPGTTNSTCGRPIDWTQVRNSGVTFAYAKSTQGTGYTNPCFAQDWAGIAAAGMLRGSYHWAEPALPLSTAVDQARYFVSRAGSMTGPMDLPGMLDLEETGGLDATDLSNWTRTFLDEVTRLTGKRPVLYMGAYFFPGTIARDIAANYRLWIPNYPCQDRYGNRICDPYAYGGQPALPAGWTTWSFWQFSSIEHVPGIYRYTTGSELWNTDMNWFCCDLGSLQALTGAGIAGGSPFGSIDVATAPSPSTGRVAGWAIDPDTVDPIAIHVYTDGVFSASTMADVSRPDVGSILPGFGAEHGFDVTFPIAKGARQVCVYGINTGPGINMQFGCRSLGGEPMASIDVAGVAAPGKVRMAGWAFDPNDPSRSIPVHFYAGMTFLTSTTANTNRPDVGAAFGVGNAHGYDFTFDVPGGQHNVCAYAINDSGPGGNTLIGCRMFTLPTGAPFGSIDAVQGRVGSINVAGWAIDPDTAASTQMHVYIDGAWGGAVTADGSRPDVGAVFPIYGSLHGYSAAFPAGGGSHSVCIYALNVAGSGAHVLLGCRSVWVPSPEPVGAVDVVAGQPGSIYIAGWALDPDTAASTQVHVYVDWAWGGAAVASGSRPDVGAVYPGLGDAHGYSLTIPASAGTHLVCVYAINIAGAGSHQAIACRSVVVPVADPFGSIDIVARGESSVRVAGWALDPETSSSIDMHIYVNGSLTIVRANGSRPDIASIFGKGPAHGYDVWLPNIGSGGQTVCVYAMNFGAGSNVLLGCRTV